LKIFDTGTPTRLTLLQFFSISYKDIILHNGHALPAKKTSGFGLVLTLASHAQEGEAQGLMLSIWCIDHDLFHGVVVQVVRSSQLSGGSSRHDAVCRNALAIRTRRS